jgi:hypothetical protein
MRVVRTLSLLGTLGLVILVVAGCERTITTVEEVQTAEACFDCHSDSDLSLVSAEEQWKRSQHASGENIDRNTRGCENCHTNEGFVRTYAGIALPDPFDNPTAIHCFTCHAPHSSGSLALRVNDPQMLQDGSSFDLGGSNICSACHQARRNVNTYVTEPTELSERWGPHHSPQSDMLLGTNGYEYAGYMYRDLSAHRTATVDGCLHCHYRVTSNYVVGGHSFNMEWDEGGEEIINTDACEPCHAGLDDFNYVGIQDSTEALLGRLQAELLAAGLMAYYPEDDEILPAEVSTSADSAGAVWNYLIVEECQSHGVHNPWYSEDLLRSSLEFLTGSPAPGGPLATR